MEIVINHKLISKEEIDKWELKRLRYEYHFLIKKGFRLNPDLLSLAHIDQAREALGRMKSSQDPEVFRSLLKKRYTFGNFVSKIAAKLSKGNRKFSMAELMIKHIDMTPEELMKRIETIMLVNSGEHLFMNLATNPDHFVLTATDKNIQEVIEYTGGSPLPTRFFAHYGDVQGLRSSLSQDYQVQAAGTAMLEDGTIIGGVRHQIKQEKDGLRFKALVEFPSVLPCYMIRKHQYHLACEFRRWIGYVINA